MLAEIEHGWQRHGRQHLNIILAVAIAIAIKSLDEKRIALGLEQQKSDGQRGPADAAGLLGQTHHPTGRSLPRPLHQLEMLPAEQPKCQLESDNLEAVELEQASGPVFELAPASCP